MLFGSLMLRQTPPTKAIISSLIYSLSYYFKDTIQKRYKHISNHEYKHCLISTPELGGGPRKFQRQGSRQFEIRCIYRGDEILPSYTRIIIIHNKPT